MPDSVADYSTDIANAKRKLRLLKRDILGTAAFGKEALVQRDKIYSFEAKLNAARADWQAFRNVFDELCAIHEAAGETNFPTTEWENYYDAVKNEVDEAEATLLRFQRQVRQEAPLPGNTSANESTFVQSHSKAHLPKISIPQFFGDITKWAHFKDTFVSMVHHETALSKVEKFHYLIGALKGEAATLLTRFPIEEQTYDQAWDKLVATYDNPRVLANLLIHRIVECDARSIKSEEHRYEVFLTEVADSIEAFRALKLDDSGDFLLCALALRALDPLTRKNFELSLQSTDTRPTVDSVLNFVRQRKLALRMSSDLGPSRTNQPSGSYSQSSFQGRFPNRKAGKYNSLAFHVSSGSCSPSDCNSSSTPSQKCLQCSGAHYVGRCEDFRGLPIRKRVELVCSWKACWNCLRKGHSVQNCKSEFRCRHCKGRHHTLVHEDRKPNEAKEPAKVPEKPQCESKDKPAEKACFSGFEATPSLINRGTVLLGTVRTLVKGQRGDLHSARAVLDSGSQLSFITSDLAQKLGARVASYQGSITTLAESAVPSSHLKGIISCVIRPYEGNQQFQTQAIVVDRITKALPSHDLPRNVVESFLNQPLADHQFGESHSVDLLIGCDLYPRLITGAPFHSGTDDIYLIPTIFGLVVSGTTHDQPSQLSSFSFFTESNSTVLCELKKFWEIEEPQPADRQSPDDRYCEEHFVRTHSRNPEGRYVVRLPLKRDAPQLGFNRQFVFHRFYKLEHKLNRNSALLESYSDFMQEYQDLGHMAAAESESSYLIPHHGVWQERPQGNKLRVVFDASCPSADGCSLNDLLMTGPKLQRDLCAILIQFRLYKIPLCADLVKMYRQILIHPEDRHLQHILWRNKPNDSLQEFELLTVTYGIKSSSFLSLRAIHQLVKDEGADFPLAAHRILNDMYVDDIVSGANTKEKATKLQSELISLFAKAGFSLSKWASTIPELIPDSGTSVDAVSLQPQEDSSLKILGLLWDVKSDSFSYTVRDSSTSHITKRSMLSAIARIFDPLGLLAPVVFTAKTLIQEVWKQNLGWDEELPQELAAKWMHLIADWQYLSHIAVPRYISHDQASHHLIGFCDASTKGYAAALYLRAEGSDGVPRISLIMAKTKVAPLKYLSVARLELCGALLLTRLISSVPKSLVRNTVCFTDSQVVLAWLNTPTHLLQVFEANRVSQITSTLPAHLWRHVTSEDNPADLASRGCLPVHLKQSPTWWSGPTWLSQPVPAWFTPRSENVTLSAVESHCSKEDKNYDWVSRFSSYEKLIRTVVRILRLARSASCSNPVPIPDPITAEEFSEAEIRCLKFEQRTHLPQSMFSNSATRPKEYAQLSPFMDEMGVLRVGGRLQASDLQFSSKHPILIPHQSSVAPIIIDYIHQKHFHSGPNLTLALLRGKYWIPRAVKLIKGRILRCVRCRTLNAKPITPYMGSLPKERFHQFRAFVHVGVDYAGPFLIKDGTRRNAPLVKAYLCLFICMASKALHLELVSSLTTAAFLDALDRFMSRRGAPNTIWSDHGRNFVGASRFLKDVLKFQKSNEAILADNLSPKGITWKFIPPRAPHFGGLWEAGVKSVKNLLTRSLGKTPHSYESLHTAFCRIEALLNSRPLCPLSEDAADFGFLTPSHLLIGAPLSSLPEPSITSQQSPMKLWKSVQHQVSSIWERWRKEYLHTLQQRKKWIRRTPNLQVGDLVILLERRSLLGHWPVARVTAVYPGRDGVTRAVDIRTPNGCNLTRAVSSLAPLFIPEAEELSGSSS